ncbi:MAG: ABC transporter ATP-binding protein/permease, partial [Oscillospiraceae bacterium]|nr:ABC transporter ATP-binding protein/permease [Oscillospiraceae bacterium]
VSFHYDGSDENVLHNISFTANPGETTAIIGSTGSGKSTLINLIPRFFDVTEGTVSIDGTNVLALNRPYLRENIGIVPQKGVLFSGTIDSNLRFGCEVASKEQIAEAAEIAQATEFIETKPEKYESPISQGGTNVSGGQKQRLSIARAVAKKPKIYIFDDSFSALDYKTDAALRKALNEKVADSTVIIVAQRISTILHAEQIIVLDEGSIAGIGTHWELLESCEVYKQIASSQLSEEELANTGKEAE